ncbi:hypothetical protein EDB85DRAFT_1893535 [Lactarius pseudohatsudake]|nr:hypothetical protein EDB85DRAFT_1893535 [Lactarius pseudohatsudake]
MHTDKSKPWSKMLVRKFFPLFPDKYDQAILNLEAEQKVLHLCSAHWKADAVVTKVFQQLESKAAAEVAPMNAAKRALELSPGPKSLSALHAQKCSKDDLISGQRTVGTKGFLNKSKFQLTISLLSFKQSKLSKQVMTLFNCVQFSGPSLPDIDRDNVCQGWGHEQFTAGGVTLLSSLTSWQEVGNVATTLKLVAATIKTCQEARSMCENARTPKMSGFISNVYLKKTLKCLESCWVGASGIKQPAPVIGIATSNTPEVPAGANSTDQQPTASMGPMGIDKVHWCLGTHTDSALLKLLQVHELQALFSNNNVSAPKPKHKDTHADLIMALVISPELSHILKSTVKGITKRGKKGPKSKSLRYYSVAVARLKMAEPAELSHFQPSQAEISACDQNGLSSAPELAELG